jgi:hypothetical protein
MVGSNVCGGEWGWKCRIKEKQKEESGIEELAVT